MSNMLKGWVEISLGELVKIGRGSSPRPIHDYLSETGIPWVKIADATASNTRFINQTKQFIREEGRSTSVSPGDLIVSNSATPGIPKIMGINACVHDGWLIFDEYKNIDKWFLFYFFLYYRKRLDHSASGSVFKNLKIDIVNNVQINLPPINEQKAIASVLSSLDSKIDLLRRQNLTLENIAQTLFKRWFIDFEFPDKNGNPYKSSGGKMVESELGEIPEGWESGKVHEEFNITMGQSPPGTSYNEIGEGTVFFQGRTDFGYRFPTERLYTTDAKRMAKKFDTLLSVRAPVGDINMALSDCCIGRGLAAITGGNSSYTYHKAKSLKPCFDVFESEGTVFGSINQVGLKNIDVVIPPKDISTQYGNISSKFDSKIYVNSKEIQTLTKTRDILLPKLMSGQIRVKD